MKGFIPLASGSKGNCIYYSTGKTKLLIDAGISAKTIKTRLEQIGVSLSEIDAILITHDHHDHIAGLKTLCKDTGIPIFANADTAKGIVETFQMVLKCKIFSTGDTFSFQDLVIHPFSIPHDTLDPVGFTFHHDGMKVAFCTDLGFVTSLIRTQLRDCDYLYVESNHCPTLVHASTRPMVYKQRVLSRVGHLSNQACAELLLDVVSDKTKHIYLAHLSSECNTQERALETVSVELEKRGVHIPIEIAQQHCLSSKVHFPELLCVNDSKN
jgi:phosphoribosyl 1,2-cyclic phosphodiesterase